MALSGWRGYLKLNRGDQSNQVAMQNKRRPPPFAVRCDTAGQENYADGTPKKLVVAAGRCARRAKKSRKEIVVNDPLVYHGVRFYQSSYGSNGKVDKLILTATPAAQRTPKRSRAWPDETSPLDENTTLRIAEFIPDYVVEDGQVYTRSAQVENPAVHLLRRIEAAKKRSMSGCRRSGFAENARSPYQFEAKDLKMGYFTGLQVSHEPGQWAVWAGVILMGIGLPSFSISSTCGSG